jgi:hypothetical protein
MLYDKKKTNFSSVLHLKKIGDLKEAEISRIKGSLQKSEIMKLFN